MPPRLQLCEVEHLDDRALRKAASHSGRSRCLELPVPHAPLQIWHSGPRLLPEPTSKHLEILDRNVGPGLSHEDAHPTGIRNNAQVVGAHTLLGFDLEDGNGHSLAEFSGMSTNQCQKALPVKKAAKDQSHNGAGATRRTSRLNLRSFAQQQATKILYGGERAAQLPAPGLSSRDEQSKSRRNPSAISLAGS